MMDAAAQPPRLCSEFVERAARGLCERHGNWASDTLVTRNALPTGPMGTVVLGFAHTMPAWHLYVPLVKLVLEELKKPTEAMIAEAQEFTSDDPLGYRQVERVLGAVIDAALTTD